MMKRNHNRLDEMQELRLLKLEGIGQWLFFWGLTAAIIIQILFIPDCSFQTIAGESIVLITACIALLIASIRKGIWSRTFAPSLKTNLVISILTGALYTVINYFRYHDRNDLQNSSHLSSFIISNFITMFILVLVVLTILSLLCEKRNKKLNSESNQDP